MKSYYSTVRVRFEFRKTRASVTSSGTVYAVIYVEGQKPELLTTGIRCEVSDWTGRTLPRRAASAKALNEKLVLWEQALLAAARTLFDRGEPITAKTLIDEKNYVNQPLLTVHQLYNLFEAHKLSLVGDKDVLRRSPGQISPETFRGYLTRWDWLRRYLKLKRQESILAIKIDAPFVQAYNQYLLTRPIGAAHVSKCCKFLTEMCQWAFNAGHLRELRTSGFRGTGVAVSKPYNVPEEDVVKLEKLALPDDQARVRDAWLLARELCLHYGDYAGLKQCHFSRDKHGRLLFEKPRVKQQAGRNIRMISLVSERAKRIWDQYGEKIPAVYSKGHIGRLLKEISLEAELPRKLIFSHARDSGIFRHVINGEPEIKIKLAAGWTSTRNLIRYVNHDRSIIEGMD